MFDLIGQFQDLFQQPVADVIGPYIKDGILATIIGWLLLRMEQRYEKMNDTLLKLVVVIEGLRVTIENRIPATRGRSRREE